LKKENLQTIGGVLSFLSILSFAVMLTVEDVPQNIVTWILWFLLDVVVMLSIIASGNKRPWLAMSFVFGAFSVSLILISKGMWKWGLVETLAVSGCVFSLIVWKAIGPKAAIIASTMAMLIAGLPATYDAWMFPNPASWWLWTGVAFGGLLNIFGAKGWTIQDSFLPIGSFLYNILMTVLVLRTTI